MEEVPPELLDRLIDLFASYGGWAVLWLAATITGYFWLKAWRKPKE